MVYIAIKPYSIRLEANLTIKFSGLPDTALGFWARKKS
jgi:hypothetical protein